MPASSDTGDDARFERRAFLTRGGLVAGGAALGTALTMSPAGAQTGIDFTYFPIAPARVYDSRDPAGLGPLRNGFERTLTTTLHQVVPPPFAITVNLTVTLTRQKGWIALFPGNESFDGTSSINWFGDFQDLANNALVAVPNDGQPTDGSLKFRCGGLPGAEAQFVVDLIGAAAPIDYGSAAAADAIAAYRAPWTAS
jgi:hypothetical protein